MARTKRPRVPELGRPEITELELGRTTHRVAEVEPMDVDGVRTMTVGTVLWAIAAIALLPFWGNLQDDGRTWWLWTAIAGLGLGLMGIEYCKRRREALRQRATEVGPAPAGTDTTTAPTSRCEAPSIPTDRPVDPARPVGRRRKN